MGFVRALFTINQIGNAIDSHIDKKREARIESLIYLGNEFVKKARLTGEYDDQTGNLRSSVGFLVVEEGKILYEDFQLSENGTEKEKGLSKGQEFARENIEDGEIALIGVAGMNYAFFVEKNGKDVITGSAPSDYEVKSILS